MADYYIGTIDPNNLANKGFNTNFNNLPLSTCFYYANIYNNWGYNNNHIAFLPDDPTNKSLDSTGTCYTGNSTYDPLNDNAGNMSGAYRVYNVDTCVEDSCIKSDSINTIQDSILQQKNTIDSSKSNIDKLEVRLTAIKKNIDDSEAASIYGQNKKNKEEEQQINERKKKLAEYQEFLQDIRMSHTNSKQLLSDRNRLIASTSSNIQTSTDKLEDLNNKINEANQEITKNNLEYEQKNKIITSLQTMITIFFILLLIMIIYYGAIYAKDAYPETYNSVANQFTNSFQNLSSFNNY